MGIQSQLLRRYSLGLAYRARGGATCPRSTPMDLPAGAGCGSGKKTACRCGLGKRCWRGSISASCSTGKKPFSTRPSCWRKKGLRSRKDPSRERYEVHGGGRRPGHTYRSATRVRANLRVPARGKHARAGESAALWHAVVHASSCGESLQIAVTIPIDGSGCGSHHLIALLTSAENNSFEEDSPPSTALEGTTVLCCSTPVASGPPANHRRDITFSTSGRTRPVRYSTALSGGILNLHPTLIGASSYAFIRSDYACNHRQLARRE